MTDETFRRQQLEYTISQANADLRNLRDENGKPRHVPAEMDKRRAQINASIAEAIAEFEAPLVEAQAAIQKELAELKPFDANSVLTELSADELGRANALRTFIAEDVKSLPAAQLGAAIEAAIAKNDRPTLVLYLRELPARVEALGQNLSLKERAEWAELQRMIIAHLTPPDDGRRATLQKKYADIVKARTEARNLTRDGQPSIIF